MDRFEAHDLLEFTVLAGSFLTWGFTNLCQAFYVQHDTLELIDAPEKADLTHHPGFYNEKLRKEIWCLQSQYQETRDNGMTIGAVVRTVWRRWGISTLLLL